MEQQEWGTPGFQEEARDKTQNKQYGEGLKLVMDQNQARDELRESAGKFHSIIENMEEGYYEVDLEGNFIFSNEAFAKIFGISKDQIPGKNYKTFISKEIAQKVFQTFNQVFHQGIPGRASDIQVLRKDGSVGYIEFSVLLVTDLYQQRIGFRGLARDVTEKKRMAEALKQSEDYHRQVVDFSNDAIVEIENLELVSVNQKTLEIFGYEKKEELLDKSFLMLVHPAERERVLDILLRRQRGDWAPSQFELKGLQKTGGDIFIELFSALIFRDGHPLTMAVIRDISDRRQVNETLLKTYSKMMRLFDSLSAILIAISEDGRIVFWNTEAEKEFGTPEEEVFGKPISDLNLSWDWMTVGREIDRCRKENTPINLEMVKFKQQSGKEGFLGIRLSTIIGEEFSGIGVIIQGANITQRKILETQLTQAQKMDAIGQLAAGIAHEINTPIQYVGDNVRFLQKSFEEIDQVLEKYRDWKRAVGEGTAGDDLKRELEEKIESVDLDYLREEIPLAIQQTLDGVDRVSRIVRSMKDFAHPGTEEKVFMDINKAIENTILVARNEWKYIADLTTTLDTGLPPVKAIPGDINQVLLNVLVNAAQAVGESLKQKDEEKGKIVISTHRKGLGVEILISDSGNGIPIGIQEKIFDPFFTTKEVGKGTGQGLAISHRAIVDTHGGSITFDTEIGKGTTFRIYLPIEPPTNDGNKERSLL